MNQDDKEWCKGWRAVLTCKECEKRIWSKKVGERVKCKCENANYIEDSPNHYEHGCNKDCYELTLEKVEQSY